jgi:hypothetical protein
MSESITYSYKTPSGLLRSGDDETLFLAKYSEIEKKDAPCFFWGRLTDPHTTARCLITLSNVVKSSFSMTAADFVNMKDPIVTAGNEKIRFEGFSQCAGVYARVDVLSDGLDGEFPENGTTNVDFNQPMISALSRIHRSEKMVLSVGQKDVTLHNDGGKIIERKVPLPVKWIKGLASVQVFLSQTEKSLSFNRVQALQLFQSLPTGAPRADYYLIVRGNKPQFSTVKSPGSVCVGGVHRLKLIEPLVALAQELRIFPHPDEQSTCFQLYFGSLRFSLTMSRDAWRGFSGEGAALESLVDHVPEEWIEAMDKYSYANQAFNPVLLAMNEGIEINKVENIAARLSSMGLLGFDLDENHFFYRRLPFKLSRILSLNPRLKEAERLLAEDKVEVVSSGGGRIEARVAGTGVFHTVILDGEKERCTCTWFSRNQGDRGLCKHVLAVKMKLNR